MTPLVAWVLLRQDGEQESGCGIKPPPGWFDSVRLAVGVGLRIPGFPPVYAVQATCAQDVQVSGFEDGTVEQGRWWGLAPGPGDWVWFWPDGSMIGVGRDTNEVERFVLALQGKLKASEVVQRGPDQRDRAEPVPSR